MYDSSRLLSRQNQEMLGLFVSSNDLLFVMISCCLSVPGIPKFAYFHCLFLVFSMESLNKV